MSNPLEKHFNHKQRLKDLDEVQHRYVIREYIKFKLDKERIEFLKNRDLWEDWKDIRNQVEPNWPTLVDIASYMFEVWDWDEYKQFFYEYRLDVFKNNKGDITSYHNELQEMRKQNEKLKAKVNKMERQIEFIFNQVKCKDD